MNGNEWGGTTLIPTLATCTQPNLLLVSQLFLLKNKSLNFE